MNQLARDAHGGLPQLDGWGSVKSLNPDLEVHFLHPFHLPQTYFALRAWG